MLKVDNITKSYSLDNRKIEVLNGTCFQIDKGEFTTIMGPSGIGKSTLLNIMGTLDKPDAGRIIYDDQEPFTYGDKEIAKFRNKHIGFVFQFHHLLPEFTALENVLIPTMIYAQDSPGVLEEKAGEMLERVGLADRIHHRPAALSGGERQRVAVARALINNPMVVLADEPSGNLDVKNSEMLIDLLLELNAKYQTTFVIATHNPQIAQHSHRILELTDGIIRE